MISTCQRSLFFEVAKVLNYFVICNSHVHLIIYLYIACVRKYAAKVLLLFYICKYFSKKIEKKIHFLYNLLKFNIDNFTLFLCKILHKRYRTRDLPLCVYARKPCMKAPLSACVR